MTDDRRRNNRNKSFLGGQVTYADGQAKHDCLIRNLSPRGAKLVFDRTVTLPPEFDLVINKQQRSFRARVMWCREQEIGVRLAPIPFVVSPAKLMRKLRSLESENERLLRRVAGGVR